MKQNYPGKAMLLLQILIMQTHSKFVAAIDIDPPTPSPHCHEQDYFGYEKLAIVTIAYLHSPPIM